MKLADWLSKNAISDAIFASRIGVSRQALWRYKNAGRTPRRPILERIHSATDGEVRPADFFAGWASTDVERPQISREDTAA